MIEFQSVKLLVLLFPEASGTCLIYGHVVYRLY